MACAWPLLATGCVGPDYNAIANRLRETTIEQEKQITALKEQAANDAATIQSLRDREGPPLQTLSADRLADLFTASSMAIGKDSRVDYWLGDKDRVDGFRVFIQFSTADGQYIPASGTMTIEAFELPPAPAEPRRLGTWTFQPAGMKKVWYSGLGLDHFAFNCPFQSRPDIRNIIFKAHFVDALSGRTLQAELNVPIDLPTTNPS